MNPIEEEIDYQHTEDLVYRGKKDPIENSIRELPTS
jgi:hypothetical protein